jgi:hypothetical protein
MRSPFRTHRLAPRRCCCIEAALAGEAAVHRPAREELEQHRPAVQPRWAGLRAQPRGWAPRTAHDAVMVTCAAGRVAVRVLRRALPKPFCDPSLVAFYEDVMVAKCLKAEAGVLPMDTRDALGRERFHPFSPDSHLTLRHKEPPVRAAAWLSPGRALVDIARRRGSRRTRTTSNSAGIAVHRTQ